MRNRIVKSVVVTVALLLTAALPASARQNDDKPLVGAGLSFLHGEGDTAIGFAVDVAKPFRTMTKSALSVVGDFGVNHFDGGNVVSILGGVRLTGTSDAKIQPYGQFLVGLEHCCGSNGFAIQPGGGLDYMYNDNLAIRAAVDFRRVRVSDDFGSYSFNETRFWFGVSKRLGS